MASRDQDSYRHRHRHRSRTHDSRSRSRSPRPLQVDPDRHSKRRRRSSSRSRHVDVLPYNARPLEKSDLSAYRPLLGLYLDIQKGLDIEELDDREVRGRWKSFLGKWNRGQLARSYYDPEMKKRVEDRTTELPPPNPEPEDADAGPGRSRRTTRESSEESTGPPLPGRYSSGPRAGPSVPSAQDLELRDELATDDRQRDLEAHRAARKAERTLQKERLDELAPRAEANTRERALEKRKETTAAHRSFAERRSPGAEEVGEGDLMGDDGIDGYRARKKETERKKSEREVRKEEILRARAAEREERLEQFRAKERDTMEMLRAVAKERFG